MYTNKLKEGREFSPAQATMPFKKKLYMALHSGPKDRVDDGTDDPRRHGEAPTHLCGGKYEDVGNADAETICYSMLPLYNKYVYIPDKCIARQRHLVAVGTV